MFIGPILRIICSQKVTFSKPVTIQLPISLRHEQQEIPDISECRVRVLCQKSAGDHGDWREITSDLRNPASFDGKFVRFQVEHFCKYAKKKKIATASCKMLETVYLYIIFSSALLSKLQGFNVQEKARLPAVLWHSTNVYTARLRPEIQPLTLLYTIFHEKEPLSYSFYWQMVPLSHTLFRTLHPF